MLLLLSALFWLRYTLVLPWLGLALTTDMVKPTPPPINWHRYGVTIRRKRTARFWCAYGLVGTKRETFGSLFLYFFTDIYYWYDELHLLEIIMLVKIYDTVAKLERCGFAKKAEGYAEEVRFGIEKAKGYTPGHPHQFWCAFIKPGDVQLSHFLLTKSRVFIVRGTIKDNVQIKPFCAALEAMYPGYPVKIIKQPDFFDHERDSLLYRFSNWYTTKEYQRQQRMPVLPFHHITEDTFGDKWNELMELEGSYKLEMPAALAGREDVMEYLDKHGFIAYEETLPITLRSVG